MQSNWVYLFLHSITDSSEDSSMKYALPITLRLMLSDLTFIKSHF